MRSKYILFALALTGALASCSDDDNNKKPVYNNPYSNPLTNYSAADPTVWKEKRSFILCICYQHICNPQINRFDPLDRWW